MTRIIFRKGTTVTYPYGKDLPSPTYHLEFLRESNIRNNPNDPDKEPWMHEFNKLIYQERYLKMELGDIDETCTPVNTQKSDMDKYMKEKERTKKHNMLQRDDKHKMDREKKPDKILEMIKNGGSKIGGVRPCGMLGHLFLPSCLSTPFLIFSFSQLCPTCFVTPQHSLTLGENERSRWTMFKSPSGAAPPSDIAC